MNLSISNIACKKEQDEKIYRIMRNYVIEGLEIAPTRVIAENPDDSIEEAKTWYNAFLFIPIHKDLPTTLPQKYILQKSKQWEH